MAVPTPRATPAKLRSIYRSLLRELPPRPLLASPRSPLHQRLRDNFTQSSSSPSPATAAGVAGRDRSEADVDTAVAQAEQFLAYFRSQRMYATLLERYNPGMHMDEEERLRLTARRVGLDMPVEVGEQK